MPAAATAADFAAFIAASPSAYHAVAEVACRLTQAGFTEQREVDAWDGAEGGHYIIRDGAIIAYRLPARLTDSTALRIVGAHTDSPGFKLKPQPEHRSVGFAQAGMEVYGGPLLNSWLDREFGLAGRIVTASGEIHLGKTGPWLRIPQLAVHLDRGVNERLQLDQQRHLMPVYALDGTDAASRGILALVADAMGVNPADIVGHDLFAYLTQPPERIGADGSLLAAGRLDNLSSVYAGLCAIAVASPVADVQLLVCNDHEEVGSATRSGAAGPFLEQVLGRIAHGFNMNYDDTQRMFARSWVVSADAGHSVHPNYPELHDPDARPVLGGGPLLKVNAKQRYTTEASGEALWLRACKAAGVPTQVFVSNNSVACGTTIGPLTATRLGINTVDVGIPLLSMHSARELCHVDDVPYLAAALQAFYQGHSAEGR
ncbi:MAG: M18 family aminopeptidase [Propionibacteriaceae bacterium]|jgi:aspartyl aminopeptidase|nr:M18 family aminopeptidase [Propionibacteriaceae bacterium]